MAKTFKTNDNLIEYDNIEVYNMVRSGAISRFPNNFWAGLDSLQTATELTRYLFEKILKWSLDDIKRNVKTDTFYDNRLGRMLKVLFDNSMYDAILNAYPELNEWVEDNRRQEGEGIGEKTERKSQYSIIRYTDEELISKVQEKAKELNRLPLMREMSEPEGTVYYTRFGTWTKTLVAAELIEDIYEGVDTSADAKKQAQQTFKNLIMYTERLPTQEEVFEILSEGEMKTYFRSLANLYEYLTNDYTEEELILILKYKQKKLKRLPVNRDMTLPRAILFIDKFDSWDNALRAAGLI